MDTCRLHARATAVILLVTATMLASGCGDSQQTVERLQQELARARDQNTALEAANKTLSTRLEATTRAARLAGRELASSRDTTAASRRRVDALVATLREVNAENEGLRNELMQMAQHSAQASGAAGASAHELERLVRENERLSRQLAALNGWLGQQNAENQTQNNLMAQLREQEAQRVEAAKVLQAELSTTRNKLAEAVTAAQTSQASNTQLEEIVDSLNAQLDSEREKGQAERARIEADNAQLLHSLVVTQEELRTTRESSDALKQRLVEAREQSVLANEAAERFRNAKNYLVEQVEHQSNELATLTGTLKSSGDERVAEIERLTRERDMLRRDSDTRAQEANEMLEQLKALEARRVSAFDSSRSLASERDTLRERVDSLRRAKDYLDGKLSAVSDELSRLRDESIQRNSRTREALRLAVAETRLLTDNNRALEQQVAALTANNETLRSDTESKSNALAIATGRIDALTGRASLLENTLNKISDDAVRATALKTDLEQAWTDLERARKRATALEGRATLLEHTLDHLVSKRSEQQEEANKALAQAKKEAAQANQRANALTERANMLERTLAFTAEQVNEAEAAARVAAQADADGKVAQCTDELHSLQKQSKDLQWANETLLREAQRLEQEIEQLKSSEGSCELRRTAL